MKSLSICSRLVCLTLLIAGFATQRSMAQAGDVVVHAATVDITHFTGTEPVDQIDMTASFTNNEFAEHRTCEPVDEPFTKGVTVSVQPGLCGAATRKTNMIIPHFTKVSPTLGLFECPINGMATADAVLHKLTRLPGTCGSYNVQSR